MSLRDAIAQRIRTKGPLRLADYIELALYHPDLGYYNQANRRSGAAGDFFTSVDVGTLFGEFLARQLDEMHQLMDTSVPLDLVEAGAGNGRLSQAVLDAAAKYHPALYDATRLTLVERSQAARAMQPEVIRHHATKLVDSTDTMPERVDGIVFANELLDALPVHAVTMTHAGLCEVHVDLDDRIPGRFVESLGPPSDDVVAHLDRFDITLKPGWRVEVSPAVVRWVEEAGSRLRQGFLVLIDYGHESAELYSRTHASGTLATYREHIQSDGQHPSATPPWLEDPGNVDITAHVDLTAVRLAAEGVGLDTLAVVDQTYFLLGLGAGDAMEDEEGVMALRRRLALKTLLIPGGLGSTHKVLIFGKNVGRPTLRGSTFSHRAT